MLTNRDLYKELDKLEAIRKNLTSEYEQAMLKSQILQIKLCSSSFPKVNHKKPSFLKRGKGFFFSGRLHRSLHRPTTGIFGFIRKLHINIEKLQL